MYHTSTQRQDPWSMLSVDEKTSLAAQVRVYPAECLHTRAARNKGHWFFIWQPGVLHEFGYMPGCSQRYQGGLTREGTLFVLVPQSLVEQRRRAWLEYLAGLTLSTMDMEVIRCYCDLAEREILEDMNPRPHPAFEAKAQAHQVSYWLGLLRFRHVPLAAD